MRKITLATALLLTGFTLTNSYALPEQNKGGIWYISAKLAPPPENYSYGVSFYTHIWPLLAKPLARFQVGLPSTWITPNNNNFEQPLCPTGTVARTSMKGPFYHFLFQTIEGGTGFWRDTQFPSTIPKYRINGTPDCYTHKISSPGWGFGQTQALDPNLMGLVQLSNHILIPPDGLTFAKQANGEAFGIAWMALPMTTTTTNPPTGDQAWTLFLNSANFAGPVASFIPNNWSRLSKNYPLINSRGLDAQPANMSGSVMSIEINNLPSFQTQDNGVSFTRVPRLQFPVDANGQTKLAQDVYFYSKDAIYTPLKNALANNSAIPTAFKATAAAAWTPTCTAFPINLHQQNNIKIQGIDNTVQTFTSNADGKCLFGLKWTQARATMGYFPNYFKQQGNQSVALPWNQAPQDLQAQQFQPAIVGQNYTVPAEYSATWSKTASPVISVKLSDGSTLQYRWYKFVDQPTLQHLNLTPAQKDALQAMVVKLQQNWAGNRNFMPAPAAGSALAQMDSALLVTPPAGMEYGYVPIVIKQSK